MIRSSTFWRATAKRSSALRQGFSLVELLIVIVLMSILAKMAITSTSASTYDQLLATANIVADELAYGRSLAVGNNSSYPFDVNLSGNRLVMRHTGADSSLNSLPNSPFRSPTDPSDQYTIQLPNHPRLALSVSIFGAKSVSSSTQIVSSI